MSDIDLLVLGAGAAGLFCAGVAARRGLRVMVLDHSTDPGEKIRISGGGRCNFTNVDAGLLERYQSADPGFARHALRAYPPADFIALVRANRIAFHEKHRGQLFCDGPATQIVTMLRAQADAGGVRWRLGCAVGAIEPLADDAGGARFRVETAAGTVRCASLVVATGGLSIPKIGATDLGHRIARRFGHRVVEPRPALVPLTFAPEQWAPWSGLAGVSQAVGIHCPAAPDSPAFLEDLLFTHRGLSGPAVLQASTFWRPGEPLEIDLAPDDQGLDLLGWLRGNREHTRGQLATVLAQRLPRRVVAQWLGDLARSHPRLNPQARLAELGNRDLLALADALRRWTLLPTGSEGWRKAEVTVGGVATAELDPRSLQSRRQPGLHFIGEVVDVTGWLGGYNFQWAWASGHAAGRAASGLQPPRSSTSSAPAPPSLGRA
ncbi:MAG: NAD(P)/FAD-dependent oxidoreductase [Burkholderiales bacterium]